MIRYIVRLQLIIIGNIWSKAELFTAMCDVEPLLDTHRMIVNDLEYFVEKEEQRLLILDKHLHVYKTEHEKAMEDIPNYLGNPINAFTLIKRLTTDLDYFEESIRISTEHIKNITVRRRADVNYPTLEDLTGAAIAIARLQGIYNLSVEDLTQGVLNGVVHSSPMTADDCYELGRALYDEGDFINALGWMIGALHKLKESDDLHLLKEAEILEYISFSHYMLGDTKSALKWAKRLLNVEQKHPRARSDIKVYEQKIAEQNAKHHKERFGGAGENKPSKILSICDQKIRIYESLCRGEISIPTKITKRLQCRYVFGPHPFLRVAPLKMELLYWRPRVAMFHHVLSDNEIQHIKDLARPKLHRGKFQEKKSKSQSVATNRISKFSWLRDEESPVVARVTQRVADMTGLNMLSAEDLIVSNYGIGGHYEPHFDFLPNVVNTSETNGKRIASVMFYMSDVTLGGATVFTELGLRIFPKKGSAVFWMNLHPSGEGDFATMHAACPVLLGSKWVCSKWIHQVGQELVRPCTLQYQPEGFLGKLPRPEPSIVR